jgi:hypothetical protein
MRMAPSVEVPARLPEQDQDEASLAPDTTANIPPKTPKRRRR